MLGPWVQSLAGKLRSYKLQGVAKKKKKKKSQRYLANTLANILIFVSLIKHLGKVISQLRLSTVSGVTRFSFFGNQSITELRDEVQPFSLHMGNLFDPGHLSNP